MLIAVIVVTTVSVIVARRYRPYGSRLRAGFHAEFLVHPGGYPGLSRHYDFRFCPEPKQMDPSVVFKAVAAGSIDVTDGFATDGRIAAYDLVVLEDDKGYFPLQQAVPIVRNEKLEEHPKIAEILNKLTGKISNEVMQYLNHEVIIKGRVTSDVVREFLAMVGLSALDIGREDHSKAAVIVGSMQSVEQEILGEIMSALIENHCSVEVIRKFRIGDTMACFHALKSGDIDLYAEYTGTGPMSILKREIILDPDKAYMTMKRVFENEYDLVMLWPFGFNNTHALIMRREHAERLGIVTISDLARYIRRQHRAMPPLTGQF